MHCRAMRQNIEIVGNSLRNEREAWAKTLRKWLGVCALTACFVTGLGAWKIRAWMADSATDEMREKYQAALDQDRVFRTDAEGFGTFMNEMHPKEVEKYSKAYRAWVTKNQTKH
jgi:hypothetical protein